MVVTILMLNTLLASKVLSLTGTALTCWVVFQMCRMSNSLVCPRHQVLQMGALCLRKETSLETGTARPRSSTRAVIQLLALLSDSLAKQRICLW